MAKQKQRRVTVSDVAAAAGVARSTAAFAISDSGNRVGLSRTTVEKVKAMAKAMNYVPNKMARSLIASRSEVIGVLLAGLWGKYAQKVVEGVREVLDKKGYVPMVTIHSWDKSAKDASWICSCRCALTPLSSSRSPAPGGDLQAINGQQYPAGFHWRHSL